MNKKQIKIAKKIIDTIGFVSIISIYVYNPKTPLVELLRFCGLYLIARSITWTTMYIFRKK